MEGFRFLVPGHVPYEKEFDEYRSYLTSVREQLPSDLFEIFSSIWYYNAREYKCPHDSWLTSVSIADGDDNRRDLVVQVLAAYRRYRIRYSYSGVSCYSISAEFGPRHEWDRDELLVTEDGFRHVIRWTTSEYWVIEAAGMTIEFLPIDD